MAQEPLNNVFAQQPKSLESPVPSDAAAKRLDEMLGQVQPSQVKIADPNAQGAMPQEPQVDDMGMQAQQTLDAMLGAPQGVESVAMPQEPGFFETNFTPSGIASQFENAEARVRASFGKTPKEQAGILRGVFGDQNVRLVGKNKDTLQIRKPGAEKFVNLEPGTFDILGDLFLDTFRDTMSYGAGSLAVAAQGPGAVEPISSGAAFIGGVAAGEAVSDYLVEEMWGVPRDPSRGGVVGPDATVGEKIGVSAFRAGENLKTGALALAFDKAAKAVGGAVAARRAKLKAVRALDDIPYSEKNTATIKETIATLDELKSLDKITTLPGTDTVALAHQLAPNSDATAIAKGLTGNPRFITAQTLATKNVDDAIIGLVEESADLTKGSLKRTLREGFKQTETAGLQQDVKGLLKQVRKAEGEVIAKFRDQASATARTTPMPTTATSQALQDIANAVDNIPDLKFLGKHVDDISQDLIENGGQGLSMDQMIGYVKRLGPDIEIAMNSRDPKMQFIGGKLMSSLRRDLRDNMGFVLDKGQKEAYDVAIGKFRKAADGQSVLRNLLKQDDMATNAFVKGIINKGRNGMQQFKAAKQFLLQEDPELWNKVTSEFFEELALKHRDLSKPGMYNAAKMRRELMGYGPEMLKELLPKGVGPKTVFKALDASDQLNKAILNASDDELEKTAKSAILATSSFISAKLNTAYAFLKFGTSDRRLLKLMNREGVDKFIDGVPKPKRAKLKKLFESIIDHEITKGTIKTVGTVGRAGQVVESAEGVQEVMQGMGQ